MSKRQSAADINVGDVYGCIEVLEKVSPETFKTKCRKCGYLRISRFEWLRDLKKMNPKKCKHCGDYKIGDVVGKMELIRKVAPEKWLIKCQNCGKTFEINVSTIASWKKRNPQYCGFCKPKVHTNVKHKKGEKFGCYELIQPFSYNQWEVKCTKCGRTQLQAIPNIRKVNADHCYFCEHPEAESNPHAKHGPKYKDLDERIYHYYKSRIVSNNDRGLKYKEWGLNLEEFSKLIHQDCYYCGEPPSNDNQWNRRAKRKNGNDGEVFLNGIDRVNPDKGYTSDNCVPCCWSCNELKTDLQPDVFFDRISRIYRLHCSQTIEKRWIGEPSRVESSDSKQSAPE